MKEQEMKHFGEFEREKNLMGCRARHHTAEAKKKRKENDSRPEVRERAKERARKRRARPEVILQNRERYHSPEHQAWVKEYRQRPEFKARAKTRLQSPEHKMWRKEHRTKPAVRAKEKNYRDNIYYTHKLLLIESGFDRKGIKYGRELPN